MLFDTTQLRETAEPITGAKLGANCHETDEDAHRARSRGQLRCVSLLRMVVDQHQLVHALTKKHRIQQHPARQIQWATDNRV
jgi:hypothetical protein